MRLGCWRSIEGRSPFSIRDPILGRRRFHGGRCLGCSEAHCFRERFLTRRREAAKEDAKRGFWVRQGAACRETHFRDSRRGPLEGEKVLDRVTALRGESSGSLEGRIP